jgi:von Willebrand factor A domain-containing protein 5
MRGAKIDQARSALTLFLRSLPVDCHFNIIGFGSRFASLFPNSRAYDDSAVRAADQWVKNMGATMGGTELMKPLHSILGAPRVGTKPRQVFVLTDGQVNNTDSVVGVVKAACADRANRTRVFALGLGAGASRALVEAIARAGGGTAAFVAPGERLQSKVMSQLKDAMHPALNDVEVSWGSGSGDREHVPQPVETAPAPGWSCLPPPAGTPMLPGSGGDTGGWSGSLIGHRTGGAASTVLPPTLSATPSSVTPSPYSLVFAPAIPPPVFDGSRLIVYALVPEKPGGGPDLAGSVTITAQSPDGPLTMTVPVSPTVHTGRLVHVLAARALVTDIEENKSMMGTVWRWGAPQLQAELVRLGVVYNLATSATSLVAVDPTPHAEPIVAWYSHPQSAYTKCGTLDFR